MKRQPQSDALRAASNADLAHDLGAISKDVLESRFCGQAWRGDGSTLRVGGLHEWFVELAINIRQTTSASPVERTSQQGLISTYRLFIIVRSQWSSGFAVR
jgi:hypothetical protein